MRTVSFLLAVLISGLLITSVQAQQVDSKWFEEKAKLLNEKANWTLFSQDSNRDMEFYYDSKNITYRGGAALVAVKKVYKSEKAISELKKERNRTMGSRIVLKYDRFSFSIVTFEILCSMKEIKSEAITVDYDDQGNILNFVPTHTGVMPIYPDTLAEKLYILICVRGQGEQK